MKILVVKISDCIYSENLNDNVDLDLVEDRVQELLEGKNSQSLELN